MISIAHSCIVCLSRRMSDNGTSKTYHIFATKPGQPPVVDNQGQLATCTRFALSKAICFGFDKKIWVKNQSLDMDQNNVTTALLQEHKDSDGKWPTDFNGVQLQLYEKFNTCWLTDIRVRKLTKKNDMDGFKKDLNSKNPKCAYVLAYEDPQVGLHCVYITKYYPNTKIVKFEPVGR